MSNVDNIFKSLQLGVKEIVSEGEFRLLLSMKKELVVKIGFDPTSDKLHLGHYVILKKLREFQLFGYFIHLIIGDFTATIGDPSGKSVMRKVIDHDDIKENYTSYNNYIFRFLDKNFTFVYFNSVWFNSIYLNDFMQLVSFVTVSRILERCDFKSRYNNNKPIGLHEFVYPLLQSYDSVFLYSDIEIGGIDQKFNLLLGRDLQKSYFQRQQVLLMMPILTGLDGFNKMSKSLNNYISLDDDYYIMFCKVMSLPDKLLEEYFICLGFLNANQFRDVVLEYGNPMLVKYLLANKVVSCVYNEFLADDAQAKFIDRVSKKIFDNNIEVSIIYIDNTFIYLRRLLLLIGFVCSHAEFKRGIKYGSIEVNSVVILDRECILYVDIYYLLKCGKKKIKKVFLKEKKNEKNVN